MPDFQTLLYHNTGGVLTITMNRPENYNAFNEQMKKEMNDAFKEAEKDASVRCIVLRGAGEKAFCSGQDLKEHQGSKHSLKESLEKSYNPLIRKIRGIEKPVVAMINGVAAGAGCSVALACDMRIMSSEAYMLQAFVNIGLVPDNGAHWFLPRLAGMTRAFEYAATGRKIPADECLQAGLVNRVVKPAELEAATMELASAFAKAPTRAIGLMKRAFNKALQCDLDSLLDYEAYIQEIASQTEDAKEGVRAFVEKRKAEFKGK
ncbi:MAG: enoyl-CoA hydratase/isomerase family protein [Bacteroidetes bacterium]|nr:enoyl-CoA hydratase/isomerase family protein [Bacteroidota bacterium]MCW5895032.1 enoyl-CoA hydratase/isomerase family protein [Bacteroidota bacterium]